MADFADSDFDGLEEVLPENPGAALLVGMLYIKLGGSFMISGGQRYTGQLEPAAYRFKEKEYPQLPYAKPHEQFYTVEQWRGASRMLAYLVRRLDPADKDLLFDLFAPIAVDPRSSFDFREHLK